MDRIESLFAAMRAAGQPLDGHSGDSIASFAQQVSQALCHYFQCSHASIWLLDGAPGEHRLRNLASHESDGPSRQNPICAQQAYPGYFQALLGQGVFHCADSHLDPRLQGLTPPPTWRSMLDVCGQINGKTIGVIALGERDEARNWTKREELDLRRATAKACLRLHALRQELETV
ncbi:GAF domain-containing protein [Roseateles amylovorans]|uniref:GAF domain-containing protein n=1 Tax=Roseateles amylovorans TaxID=2978473 RepID=A0ABY6B0N9_9BURK|nr:GAF domain-containing protein [Roseateles amylovorans]UXH78961.1 GAF domain-containing protein [Roseateles amylovorans]